MRTIGIAMGALLLAGCTTLDYQPRAIGEREAYAVITEVAMQQPAAPASTYLDSNYLGFRDSESPITGKPQDIRERIYFNSLDSIELHRGAGGYLVRLQGPGGERLREFRIDERPRAERFIDALNHYRAHAPAFSGLK